MLSVGELTTTDGSGVGWDSRKRGFSEYHVQTLQNSHMSIRYLHEAMILVSFYSVLLIPVIYVFGGLLIFLEVLRVNLPASRKSKSEEHPLTSLSHTYRLLPSTKKLMKVTVFLYFCIRKRHHTGIINCSVKSHGCIFRILSISTQFRLTV